MEMTLRKAAAMLVAGLALIGLILTGLCPVAWVFSQSTESIEGIRSHPPRLHRGLGDYLYRGHPAALHFIAPARGTGGFFPPSRGKTFLPRALDKVAEGGWQSA